MLRPQFMMASRGGCGWDSGCFTTEHAIGLDQLDSRAIGRTSCFAQRFMRPGCYRYNVVPGYGQSLSADYPFEIHVTEQSGSEMTQHNVVVTDADKGFSVDQAEIRINTGDLVLWTGNGATRAPFAIAGDQPFFNSHRMTNECGYSHAFGSAGDYHWVDAYGSGLAGLVRVRKPDGADSKALSAWQAQLSEGNLVMIADGKVDRAELDIMVGQTVFFAIVTGPGISITDKRLLEIGTSRASAA
jgi:plastocyanin